MHETKEQPVEKQKWVFLGNCKSPWQACFEDQRENVIWQCFEHSAPHKWEGSLSYHTQSTTAGSPPNSSAPLQSPGKASLELRGFSCGQSLMMDVCSGLVVALLVVFHQDLRRPAFVRKHYTLRLISKQTRQSTHFVGTFAFIILINSPLNTWANSSKKPALVLCLAWRVLLADQGKSYRKSVLWEAHTVSFQCHQAITLYADLNFLFMQTGKNMLQGSS